MKKQISKLNFGNFGNRKGVDIKKTCLSESIY